jgi:hypothetical protein
VSLYLHATLTPVPGRLADLGDTVAWLKKGMERQGWVLRRAFASTSGEPGTMIDLWEVPDANTVVDALAAGAAHPRHGETLAQVAEVLADEVLRLVAPAPRCPDFRPAGGTRYLQVAYRVGYGGARTAWTGLPAPDGWHLAAAFETVIGDLCEAFELWELPGHADATALGDELPAGVRARTVTELTPLAWSF